MVIELTAPVFSGTDILSSNGEQESNEGRSKGLTKTKLSQREHCPNKAHIRTALEWFFARFSGRRDKVSHHHDLERETSTPVELVTTTYQTGVKLTRETMDVVETQRQRWPSREKRFVDIRYVSGQDVGTIKKAESFTNRAAYPRNVCPTHARNGLSFPA